MSPHDALANGMVRPARHDLLRVAAEHWPVVAATRPPRPTLSTEQAASIERWGKAGWPVITRRVMPGDEPGIVPVGLPLPPCLGKARITLAIPSGVSWQHMQGVSLADARDIVPLSWRGPVDAVLSLGRTLGLVPRVFGALLWQALTGLHYLQPTSDLDLLWPVRDATTLGPLLNGLEEIDVAGPVRIDGEVRTAQGDINWRELADARRAQGGIVMAKSMQRAGLVSALGIVAHEVASCC